MRKSKPVQSQPKNRKAFAENNGQQPTQQEKLKPDSETELALVSSPPSVDPLILDFAKAHAGFEWSLCEALGHARDAGESLLKLHSKTGLKGVPLFAHVREQGEITVSDRSCYLYQRIASRWNELQVRAGDELPKMSLTKAIKLLQEPKKKPKDKSVSTDDQGATEIASNASQNNPAEAQLTSEKSSPELAGSPIDDPKPVNAKPQEDQEAEKAIKVPQPFDQLDKDRLAALYAQNGPASTPIQLMTNLVIPNLKKVVEVEVGVNDVPFLASAINEALALIEALKQKCGIS